MNALSAGYRNIYGSILLLLIMAGITSLVIPPALGTDSAQGFHVLRSMQLGAHFNCLVSPGERDIARNDTTFLTWWSPGQYCVPQAIHIVTRLDPGKSISLAVWLAEFTGFAGFYFFFRKIGFPPMVTAMSLLFIVFQKATLDPFLYYDGGEVLLFSFQGWFLYGCVCLPVRSYYTILFIVASAFWGFFLKSSFLWMYGAGLFAMVLKNASPPDRYLKAYLENLLRVSLPAATALAILYLFYISKGESPVQVSAGFRLTLEAFTYPLASPVLSGFSLDEMLNGIIVPTGDSLWISFTIARCLLILGATLGIIFIFLMAKGPSDRNYRIFLIVFYLAALLFFTHAYLFQYDISMEPRHFRILGILLIPGLVSVVWRSSRFWRIGFLVIFLAMSVYTTVSSFNGFRIISGYAIGKLWIAQPDIDQASLNQLLQLDQRQNNAIFVLVGHAVGLEIRNNRVICLEPIGDDLKPDTALLHYHGHGAPLYMVLPRYYSGVREKIIFGLFPGYRNFRRRNLSDYYELVVAD
jgi:hypothetical protein